MNAGIQLFLSGIRWIACAVFVQFLATSAHATIQYEVSLEHPEQHLFHVRMIIPDVAGDVDVQMAAWNALYQIRDFSAHVQNLEATIDGQKVRAQAVDKQTWHITGQGTVVVQYATFWDEPGPFAAQLNAEHGFMNPAMILCYVPQRRPEPVTLKITDLPPGWRVASALISGEIKTTTVPNINTSAVNFDALADAPFEAGKFELFRIKGGTSEVWVAIDGDNWRKKKVESDLQRICQYELRLMEDAPFPRFLFIIHSGKNAAGAGGGMEHANSTAIAVPSDEFLEGVAAHEFFHLWNVKRIRPSTLEPIDYTREQYTRALWFAEGVTSTYGSYTLVRASLWEKKQFYQDAADQITELESRPANHWQSAEQSSIDAWLEKYSLYNSANYSISYYTKGQILGDLLDILIRDRTDNTKSLDDVMRFMNATYARQNKTYRDNLDIRLAAETIAGGSFEEFFAKYVAAADPLPYAQILQLAGLDLKRVEYKRAVLGFETERDPSGAVVVQSVDPQSPATALHPGDILLTWNDAPLPRRIERLAQMQKPGGVARATVRRDGKEIVLEVRLGEATDTRFQISEDSRASEKAKRIREGILHGSTTSIQARSENGVR